MANDTNSNNSDNHTADCGNASPLGTGVLTWNRRERVTDRYGTVRLGSEPDAESTVALNNSNAGSRGTLFARILETRKSTHIGDCFRNLFPTTPTVGDRIKLGYGQLFFEEEDDVQSVGVCPPDGRHSDWLEPKALYTCHHQTVELLFVADDVQRAQDDAVSYRVWIAIEEHEEATHRGRYSVGPAAPLANFSTYEEAHELLDEIYSARCALRTGERLFTVVGYWHDTENTFVETTAASSPDEARDRAIKQIAHRNCFDTGLGEAIKHIAQQTQIIAVFQGHPKAVSLDT
jgi:hypothetical protein